MSRDLQRRLLAELVGSAFLAAIVIGSGIAAQHLSPHEIGLELFENAAATAAGLFAIILMLGPVSGAHFNPAVSLVDATFGGLAWKDALVYILAQVSGCVLGALAANGMFDKTLVTIAQLVGAAIAIGVIRTLYPDVTAAQAADVVLPHREEAAATT